MEIKCESCEHKEVCKHKENMETLIEMIETDIKTYSNYHELMNLVSIQLICSKYLIKGKYNFRKDI